MTQESAVEMAIAIMPDPIKLIGEQTMSVVDVNKLADVARECLEDYDDNTRGTCIDERPRVGLLDGTPNVEARPSSVGGPNIYALYLAELIGYFGNDEDDGEAHLSSVTELINSSEIPSGGHAHCKANGSFGDVIEVIASQRELIDEKVRASMGDEYDPDAVDEIYNNATRTYESGRYSNWNEDVLAKVLGDEAGQAIEVLADIPHLGKTFIRESVPGKTVDQTKLHERTSEYSFVHTENYAERIENAIASGPDAEHMTELARHAREILLVAISIAVPNEELHGISIDAQ